ncbi:MAG: Molybdopterin molybdenumtransferase [Thermoanaerobaculia bacterium]|nr:Molybdopterin molybdenumtransferase [Thermoanaerobaculia bacterium]
MIAADTAWNLIVEETRPLDTLQVGLEQALGFVLAEPVLAERDFPPCDRSSVDGFAVRAEETGPTGAVLRIAGEVAAGSPPAAPVSSGTCVRIFTGACLPAGADAAVMLEDVTETADGSIQIEKPVRKGENILEKGEDCRAGTVLLTPGDRLGPVQIAIAASAGASSLSVYRRPRVTVLVTGQELEGSEKPLPDYKIHDSNGPMIWSLVTARGFAVVAMRRVPDDLETTVQRIEVALRQSDVVVLSGGVSVGKYDFVPEAIRRCGGTIVYHGVSLKPGKPQLFSRFGGNRYAFGLPGNPLSALTGMTEFVLPALKRLAGLPPDRCQPDLRLPLLRPLKKGGPRQRVLLGRVVTTDGRACVEVLRSHSSGDLVSASAATGLILAPPSGEDVPAGGIVTFRPFGEVA